MASRQIERDPALLRLQLTIFLRYRFVMRLEYITVVSGVQFGLY
jgi:hypothetical protein